MSIIDARTANSTLGAPSFTFCNRLYRASWVLTWALLASWTPAPLFGWRRMLLRLFGARLGPKTKVYPSVKVWSPRNLVMDEYACLGPGVIVYSMAMIRIGAFALVSQRGHLCAGTHDIEDSHFQLKARPIGIGARAWIAAEAFVGPGVQIGEGAILGARAVAMRDVPGWAICSGNPAVKLRDRVLRFPPSH